MSALPELQGVYWRKRASDASLRARGRGWTASTVAHTVPFVGVAGLMIALNPVAAPVSALALVQAWILPELYAARGANVVRPKAAKEAGAEAAAVGLLGDLVGHAARETHAETGLVPERGELGVWLVGEQGALLVRPGGRQVQCFCVRATDPALPGGDRIAHLLLALREDETGFATVANMAFSGARWRVRRRVAPRQRPALDEGARLARQLVTAGP